MLAVSTAVASLSLGVKAITHSSIAVGHRRALKSSDSKHFANLGWTRCANGILLSKHSELEKIDKTLSWDYVPHCAFVEQPNKQIQSNCSYTPQAVKSYCKDQKNKVCRDVNGSSAFEMAKDLAMYFCSADPECVGFNWKKKGKKAVFKRYKPNGDFCKKINGDNKIWYRKASEARFMANVDQNGDFNQGEGPGCKCNGNQPRRMANGDVPKTSSDYAKQAEQNGCDLLTKKPLDPFPSETCFNH